MFVDSVFYNPGFLKMHHHYTIEFDVKDNLGEDVTTDPLQNLHCRITACPPTEDGMRVTGISKDLGFCK